MNFSYHEVGTLPTNLIIQKRNNNMGDIITLGKDVSICPVHVTYFGNARNTVTEEPDTTVYDPEKAICGTFSGEVGYYDLLRNSNYLVGTLSEDYLKISPNGVIDRCVIRDMNYADYSAISYELFSVYIYPPRLAINYNVFKLEHATRILKRW